MKLARTLLIGLLGVGLLVGCDEDGTGPGGLTLADLVGTWDATVFVFVSQTSPPDSADFIAEGVDVRLTVAANGDFSIVMWGAEGILDIMTGTVSVSDGTIVVNDDEEPGNPTSFAGSLSGNTLMMDTDEVQFDFGSGDEPADLHIVLGLKAAGRIAGDLVGEWSATSFLFISEAVPPDTFDTIAEGGGLEITVTGDSRYAMIVQVPSQPADTIYGTLLILTGQLWLIDEPDTDIYEWLELFFELVGDTLLLEGEEEFDFGGGDEPATMEVVLER